MPSLDPVIEKIFAEALEAGASDIHLEPQGSGMGLRWRIGGQLRDGPPVGAALKDNLVAKLKLLARLDPTQSQTPQDGAFVIQGVHARLSAIPALGGQSLVVRLFRQADELQQLGGLGLQEDQLIALGATLKRLQGLVIIAGPTGSGKTTTFYAALRALDPAQHKVITVEDPVEQRLSGVCQVPVKGELTFATALRSILRQAPNVIGVGELRDADSARMAVQAALTGHLVVATLHADSAAAVPVRLIDMGVEPAILAQVLEASLAQRLIFYKNAAGQNACRGVFELMRPDVTLRAMIAQRQSLQTLQTHLAQEGFVTLWQRAQTLAQQGCFPREALLGEFWEDA